MIKLNYLKSLPERQFWNWLKPLTNQDFIPVEMLSSIACGVMFGKH